jgi:nicotinamidase-related amidase
MDNIKKLISAVRDNGVEVVYVCHDVRKIEQSEDEWEICEEIAPNMGEMIFYKQYNSAFGHGYKVIIPEETNTTFDNEYLSADKLYEFYNFKIWDKRFAYVLPVEEAIKILSEKGKI